MGLIDLLLGRKSDSEKCNDEVLLGEAAGFIYSWDGKDVKKLGGSGLGVCIAEHKNELYEGGRTGSIAKLSSVTGESVPVIVAKRGGFVKAICSHNRTLYDAQGTGIHETLTGKRVASRKSRIEDLESHEGGLYDCGDYGICDTLTGKKVSDEESSSICSSSGVLYATRFNGIFDVFSGERVAKNYGFLHTPMLCSLNHQLFNSDSYCLARDTIGDKTIINSKKYGAVVQPDIPDISKYYGVDDIISINGLAHIAATDGRDAAFNAIDVEYKNQLSQKTVKDIIHNKEILKNETVNVLESGTTLYPEQQMFIPDLLTEFILDPGLGIIHGKGRGHAIINTDALANVAAEHSSISDYPSLAKAFFEDGYHVKRVGYIHFNSK